MTANMIDPNVIMGLILAFALGSFFGGFGLGQLSGFVHRERRRF